MSKTKSDFVSIRTTMHCMIMMLEGEKIAHLKDGDISISSSEICFLTQNNYFLSERLTKEGKYKSLLVYFDDDFVADFVQKYKIDVRSSQQKDVVTVNYKRKEYYHHCLKDLSRYLMSELDAHFIRLKVEEILLHALREKPKELGQFLATILASSQDRIKYILESNIDLLKSIEDMYRITRLSEGALRRYIKKIYRVTPKVWLDRQRLERSVVMLKNTDQSISQIAAECGYSTVSWFIAQFKNQYGQTPKVFRNIEENI
ncbi:MAG: AraC family transcriptional regulator [Campylobacterota bacterium]